MLPSCNVSASMFAWRRRQNVSLNRRMEGLLSTRNGSRTTRPSFRVARDTAEAAQIGEISIDRQAISADK